MFLEKFKHKVKHLALYVALHFGFSPLYYAKSMRESTLYLCLGRRPLSRREGNPWIKPSRLNLVVQQRILQQTAKQATDILMAGAYVYQTVFNQIITPFMACACSVIFSSVNFQEILQNVQAKINSENIEQDIAIQISRGFSLTIEGLGDLLVSHDGSVVLNSLDASKSVKVNSPSQVILNNTTAKSIEIEAQSAFLMGNVKSNIESLSFTSTNDEMNSGLFIDAEAELFVDELVMENSLLLNSGILTVGKKMNFNEGYLFNLGSMNTSADPTVFESISYLYNGKEAKINASGKLIVDTISMHNDGQTTYQNAREKYFSINITNTKFQKKNYIYLRFPLYRR